MGTNYYAVKNRPSVREPIHIGKSSAGWLFGFEIHNDKWTDVPVIWNTYDQVKDWLQEHTVVKKDYVIINEYDEIVSFDEFIQLVEDKQNDNFCRRNKDNFSNARNVNGYRFIDAEFS